MTQRQVTIMSAQGLHARPASQFTQAAAAAGMPVTIARPGEPGVNAASILMVMSLRLQHGEVVELSAEGDGAEVALDGLSELLARDLDAVEEAVG